MEVGVHNSDALNDPKKSRSEDLKGIFADKSSRKCSAHKSSKGLKRGNRNGLGRRVSFPVESWRKRSRKDASLSSLEPISKKQRNSSSAFVSGIGKQDRRINRSSALDSFGHNIDLASLKNKGIQASGGNNSEYSNGLADDVVIPKRPRGVLRQIKVESSVTNLKVGKDIPECSVEGKIKDQVDESPYETVLPSQVLACKSKKKANRIKENHSGDLPSDGTKVENRIRSRRKKVLGSIRPDYLEITAPSDDNNEKFCGEEDNVGNLEENAARMLSSRFDPSCTGFLVDRVSCSSKPANGDRADFKSSRSESFSVDAAGRSLRPRRRRGRNLVRTRRHFYEVCSSDVDPYFIVKQRIRVFWPLDKSWYFGLVKDYDPVRNLHHVKYDDRDEEWIDLRSERFKLLVFPSEISGNFHTENSTLELNQKESDIKEGKEDAFDDCCLSNSMDSEPIISWLTRTKHRRKSSSVSIIKKQSRSHVLKDFRSSISLEQEHSTGSTSAACSQLEETLREVPQVKSRTSSSEGKVPFVYFRKRFHKSSAVSTKIMEHDSVLGSSAGSIGILAFAADSAAVLEELNVLSKPVEVKQVTVNLSLQSFSVNDLAYGNYGFSLWHLLFPLQSGKVIQVWPMVRMEIAVVDKILGLRLLSFEGSLICVVGFLCATITGFYQCHKQSKLTEQQMPFTSIGFQLTGLHDLDGYHSFALYSFLQLDIVKWRYLEDKLKVQCLTTMELSVVDCTHSKIKDLLRKSDQMLCASVYKKALSFEGSPERSFADDIRRIISKTPIYLNMSTGFCYIEESHESIHTRSLSFATSPSFFMSLQLRLLIESNVASSSCSQEFAHNHDKLFINGSPPTEDPSDQLSDITIENAGSLSHVVTEHGKLSVAHLKVETDALSFSNDGDWRRSSDKVLRNDVDMIGNSLGGSDLGLNESDETVVRTERSPGEVESSQDAVKSYSGHDGFSSQEKSEGDYSPSNANVQSQPSGHMEDQSDDKGKKVIHGAPDLAWELNECGGHSTNPTAPRSFWHRNRHSSLSPTFVNWSNFWSDDLLHNGLASRSKKPRTQVSCSFPSGGNDLVMTRQNFQRKVRSYRKVKTANASGNARNYHVSLTCDANVLVAIADRGWRECGALVILDSDGQKDWRICVKLSGSTKYEYKVLHMIQPGITNRYTHAMMWKGGKDWCLEFTDRNQWSIFKEIHEECYNHNIRATYVKNIPIPGVRLIAEADDRISEASFVRSSSKYYRQVATDVDMALDPSHVLYDMDSSDEEWISEMRYSLASKESEISELTDNMFERVIDTFEKFAYSQRCDEFSIEEIEEFMTDAGRLEIVKAIYEHWREKRLDKGLPLIRQFQPPLWMHFQQQLKDWEVSTRQMHISHDRLLDRAHSFRKPSMFAFCLRPRGLEIPNKGPKQRSHKKILSAGCHKSFDRRWNGFSVGAEKTAVGVKSYESSDSDHSNDGSEKYRYPELLCSNNSRKRGMLPSPSVHFACSKKFKRNGVGWWSGGHHEWPSMQQDGLRSETDEFGLRDASGDMAKLKREKAQWLLHKADLALHKATAALVIAEAIKESEKDLVRSLKGPIFEKILDIFSGREHPICHRCPERRLSMVISDGVRLLRRLYEPEKFWMSILGG